MARPLDTEVLARARALVANPDTWTQGATARDARGRRVEPEDDEAVRFCLIGALHRACAEVVAPLGVYNRASARLEAASFALGKRGAVSIVNDTEGHAGALALIDAAIQQEKG